METAEDRATSSGSAISPIRQFAIKTGIVACACVIAFIIVLSYLDDLVQDRVDQIRGAIHSQIRGVTGPSGRIGGREFWAKIEKALDEQADPKNDLSPEKRQKLLAQIRTISDRWRPFIAEALGTECRPTGQKASP